MWRALSQRGGARLSAAFWRGSLSTTRLSPGAEGRPQSLAPRTGPRTGHAKRLPLQPVTLRGRASQCQAGGDRGERARPSPPEPAGFRLGKVRQADCEVPHEPQQEEPGPARKCESVPRADRKQEPAAAARGPDGATRGGGTASGTSGQVGGRRPGHQLNYLFLVSALGTPSQCPLQLRAGGSPGRGSLGCRSLGCGSPGRGSLGQMREPWTWDAGCGMREPGTRGRMQG